MNGEAPPHMSHLARARRTSTLAVVGAVLIILAGCSDLLTPTPAVERHFDLVADTPVAGAQIESVLLQAGTVLVSAEPLRDDVWVRAARRGNRLYVAWVARTAEAGPQVRVELERTDAVADVPSLVAGSSYTASDDDDLGESTVRWRGSDGADASGVSSNASFDATQAEGPLEASFAAYEFGDLRRSGEVDVRDAMRLLDLLRFGGWDDFERYHGNVDGDEVLDASDLDALLEKIVDPELPAILRVAPSELTFRQLSGTATEPSVVLVGNAGSVPFASIDWVAPSDVAVTETAGVPGRSAALAVDLPPSNRIGWKPRYLHVQDGGGAELDVRLGHLVALVAGQSNAVGWGRPITGWPESPSPRVGVLGNDYRWEPAVEPLDSASGQEDDVSEDTEAKYSFGTRLGNLLHDATGFATYLIPSAKGGSQVTTPSESGGWLPGVATDRSTLFGSAVFRSRVSAGLEDNPLGQPSEGGPVNVFLWYQGESDAGASERRGAFVDDTRTVINAFWEQLAVPIVYVQLATHEFETPNLEQAWIAERQRRLETGSGTTESAFVEVPHHMVVAFDLPRSDTIHLSAYGQRLLAERLDLAVREHVLGEPVDGTGPRLEGIDWSGGAEVTLRTTHTLRGGAIDPGYVTVFDGSPNGVTTDTDLPTGTNTIDVSAVERDPSDPTAVRITLASIPTGKPHVLYTAPAGIQSTTSTSPPIQRDLIRAAEGVGVADLGLPLPTFGPLAPD